jgi:K+-sensing histidine kinase KdpD
MRANARRRDGMVLEPVSSPPGAGPSRERVIEIAVFNLIDNALKYAADGKSVCVTVRRARPLEIRVTIEARHSTRRASAFERFERGRTATGKTCAEAASVSRSSNISEAHGGRVTVENASPSGSTFVISLVARKSSAAPQGATSPSSVAP